MKKFKIVAAEDVEVLRKAKKILKKLQKQLRKFEGAIDKKLMYGELPANSWKLWRLYDELEALSIGIEADESFSLNTGV